MKATELVAKCIDIATNYKTVYMWGCIGMPVTEASIQHRAAQYKDWYTAAKVAALRKLIGKDYWGFDCVNLIKAVLWGWRADKSKSYGGAAYLSGGVPDVSADGAIKLCRDVTTDFSGDIPVGAALWCSGHIGLYIGGGLAVECTPSWANGVQITAVLNIGQKSGYSGRSWTKWGLLPWVEYESATEEENAAESNTDEMEWIGMKVYEKLADVPEWYQPTIRKLMERGALLGGNVTDILEDRIINVDETYCRIMVTLDRLGKLE